MRRDDDGRWTGTWATAPVAVEGMTLAGQTLRTIARVSLGGSRVRVRLSNTYGSGDLAVGAAHVGLRGQGANLVPGSGRPLTFGGSASAVIPAGALIVSDPVDLDVAPLTDLAVSVYLPDPVTGDFQLTGHDPAHQTNYLSSAGNFAAADDFPVKEETEVFLVFPVKEETEVFLVVTGVEVLAPASSGGIVAFGDSLTEGNLSRLDANDRWPDQLARRLAARDGGRPFGVVNQGTGGGRLLHDGHGDSGLRRFDRDVLAQPGATHVVVLLGINDLRNSQGRASEVVTAAQLITGLRQLAVRAHVAGLTAYAGTVLPWENETFNGGHYTPSGEAARLALNAWIRDNDVFDAVLDFEAALRDPARPARLLPSWDSGDHLHPNDLGYRHMGDSVDLALFG